ncbi:DoxX family membrane protein [Bacillus alkalicellulosilyticus]|uniref:DoxX family membrane protein n=1 Tax=Alkalihalobacterium alkalicellulosilyticum TaxID=1912214 RepID=UPI000997159B|nr:DoxX family membrane protein [Bacillus alkalicellulosilyticus]
MKKFILSFLLFVGIIFTPFIALAHVKWFTDVMPVKESIDQIITPLFMALTIITALVLAILPQVLPKVMQYEPLRKIDHKLDGFRKYTMTILRYGTAISLLLQVFSGSLFAPEIEHNTFFITILTWIMIVLLLIPYHLATKAAGVLMFSLYIYFVLALGIFHMLDYGFYIAIAFVLLMAKTKYENWSFPFLYLATGLSLCWVAAEKWVYPSMSADIIASHNVPTFFFSPETFIVISAFIEFVVGYLLIVGILNRLLAFVLTGIFIMTTTLFGYVEIVGHSMIHFILVLFIIEGVSFYKPPIKIHKTVLDQVIFVFLNYIFVLATVVLLYYRFA